MNDRYILFGAGKKGKNAVDYLGKDKISFFCDNRKHNLHEINDIPVLSFDEMLSRYAGELVVITATTSKSVFEILSLLNRHHIKSELFDNIVSIKILEEEIKYNELNKRESFVSKPENQFIISKDKGDNAGAVGSYFWQDLWAARHIFAKKPEIHFDIGSRVDGFIAHLLSFNQHVKQIDIRPLQTQIKGWDFVQGDATNLDGIQDESIESLSALCSLEHFGLGRYGDPIDPEACFKCFDAIQRKVKNGGIVYISVPIGKEHIEFNAHRVFSPHTISDSFGEMELIEFSTAIDSEFHENADLHAYDSFDSHGGRLFGLFMFQKKEKK